MLSCDIFSFFFYQWNWWNSNWIHKKMHCCLDAEGSRGFCWWRIWRYCLWPIVYRRQNVEVSDIDLFMYFSISVTGAIKQYSWTTIWYILNFGDYFKYSTCETIRTENHSWLYIWFLELKELSTHTILYCHILLFFMTIYTAR